MLQRPYKMIFLKQMSILGWYCLFSKLWSFWIFEKHGSIWIFHIQPYYAHAVSNYEIPDAQEMLTQMEMWANVLCLLVWWGSRKLKIKSFISTKLRKITYFSLHTFWIEMGWWIGYLAQKGQEHPLKLTWWVQSTQTRCLKQSLFFRCASISRLYPCE